jgi:hypothetical protein
MLKYNVARKSKRREVKEMFFVLSSLKDTTKRSSMAKKYYEVRYLLLQL